MARLAAVPSLRVAGLLVFLTSLSPATLQEAYDSDLSTASLNCTTPDNFVSFHPTNASHLEEPRAPIYRGSKDDQQQFRDDQHLNRHLDDQRSYRYPDDQQFNRRYDDQQTNKHLDDEDTSADLKVRPLNSHVDDEKGNRKFDEHEVNKNNNDEFSNRYDDKEKLNRYSDEHQLNKNSNSEFSNRYRDEEKLDKYLDQQNQNSNDEFSNRYGDKEKLNRHSDDHDLNRSFDDEHPIRHYKDQHTNWNLHDEQPGRHFSDRNVNRNFNDQYSNKNLNEQHLNRDHDDKRVNSNLDNQYQNRDYNQNSDEHLVDQYPERHLDDRNPNRRLDDLHPDKGFKDQDFERHIVDQHPDRTPLNHHPDKTRDDLQPNKYREDLQPNKYRDDLQPNKYYDDLQPSKHLDDLQPDRRLGDPNFDRRLNENQPDTHLDDQHSNRHLDDSHPDRRLDNEHANKNVDNLHADRRLNEQHPDRDMDNMQPDTRLGDPHFETRLVEQNTDRHLDDLHPDRHINDQNFERRLIDQPADSRLGVDLHPDRRISEEKFDRRVIDQYSEKKTEDQGPDGDGLHPERRLDDKKIFDDEDDETTTTPRKESNVSHLMTFTLSKEWEESKPKLNFPKKSGDERFRMATLHLDKGLFAFDFLRSFLSLIQPRNVPLDLLKDTLEGKVNFSTVIKQSIHLEIVFLAVISVFIVLMFVVPGTECWLCCRRNRYNYQRRRHSSLMFFLSMYTIIIGACVVTMLICNEEMAGGLDRIPETMEAALQDLRDYHSGTAEQLRKCLTRSLDVASEAVLADLDNVEDLLGKPVQAQLSSETGVDVALDALMDVANASHELAYKTDGLLKRAERAREFGAELSREADEIRRDLERTARDCAPEDRSLCAVLDPSGLHLALRLERVARDDRLLRLRQAGRENLTESGRQARGEYLYVPHHVARTTLEARNQIRREINTARAKVSDEARSIEASGSNLSNQLDTARRLTGQIQPYVRKFEYARWFVGFGTAMCVLLIWLLLFGALCCRCGSSEDRVRPTLLWFVFLSCLVSMVLWLVLMAALAIASHAEMLLCRPLDDPEFRTVEAILETKVFFGRRLSVPLKDLFEKCEQNDPAYSAFQLDNNLKLEQLTAHWTWSGLGRAFGKLKVDLTSLRILSPNLRDRLQNLLYASGPNLTEHRIMIQGPILNKDLNALSDQVENVARQLTDRRTARSFQTLAAQMRDLLSRRVKPLMKMQDELVYQLATLELHLQPLQRQVNQSLSHLRTIQYYIDNQGEKIAQLKTKAYVDRLSSYLDQWRAHVLTEMSSGVAKCRPLWDILQGIKLLVCSHILGPLNGFWFATLVCVLTMLASTPSAHTLASSYWRQPASRKGSVLLPSRQGSPDTIVMARETWRTPDPPPSMDSW